MGREQISQSPQYHDLVGLIKRTDPVVVRQVVRDLHETCLLGSDYHYAFLVRRSTPVQRKGLTEFVAQHSLP